MDSVQHYVQIEGEQRGPYTIDQLRHMWRSGSLTRETPHLMDGYDEWQPLSFIADVLEPTPTSAAQSAWRKSSPVVIAKSRGIYIILGLFLGGLGIHNFYVGRIKQAIIQLSVALLTGWLVLPLFLLGIWIIIELFTVKKDDKGHPLS